jgi:hypothetical protein
MFTTDARFDNLDPPCFEQPGRSEESSSCGESSTTPFRRDAVDQLDDAVVAGAESDVSDRARCVAGV